MKETASKPKRLPLYAALASTPCAIPEPSLLDAHKNLGLFFEENIFEPNEFDTFIDLVHKSTGTLDTSMKRDRKVFGFELDRKGNILRPAPPIPDACAPPTEYLLGMGQKLFLDTTLDKFNQMSANTYAPKVGIGPHVDKPGLGEFAGIALMGGGATILFTPVGGGSPTHAIYMPPCCDLILTGDTSINLPTPLTVAVLT